MNPFLGFILGFISRFLIDIIPHGDENIGIKSSKLAKKERFIFLGFIDNFVASTGRNFRAIVL